jgi:hypothetical protein
MWIFVGASLIYILYPMIEEWRQRRLDVSVLSRCAGTLLWVTVGTLHEVGGRTSKIHSLWGAFTRLVPKPAANGVAPGRRSGIGFAGCRQASQHTYRAPQPIDCVAAELHDVLGVHRHE